VELVHEVSSRNPYWTIAIAEFVREVGVDNFCKGIDATTASVGSCMPSSTHKSTQLVYLRHLVTCMMDLLTVTEQIVLKYSSVIGLKFSLPILSEILPNNDSKVRLKKAIKTLVDRRFIMHYPSEESIYTFQNYNIREVIYSLIPPRSLSFSLASTLIDSDPNSSDAATLHLRIGEEIETHYQGHLRPYYDTYALSCPSSSPYCLLR
jgi:hypothetical protein